MPILIILEFQDILRIKRKKLQQIRVDNNTLRHMILFNFIGF